MTRFLRTLFGAEESLEIGLSRKRGSAGRLLLPPKKSRETNGAALSENVMRHGRRTHKGPFRIIRCAQSGITWYAAAAYCNWLSEQAGISESEWAYRPNSAGEYAEGMTTSSQFPLSTGYRLPTDAEWEFACRGGTVTFRPFGSDESFLPEYAWCLANSNNQIQPVGRHKPNDFGCFDMLGNLIEWCHSKNRYLSNEMIMLDTMKPNEVISDRSYRLLRGGSYGTATERLDSADRTWWTAGRNEYQVGFRVARTLIPAEHDQSYLLWNEAMDLGSRGEFATSR